MQQKKSGQEKKPAEISRSQLKREADILHELGRDLVKLPVSVLQGFSLPDNLFEAIKFAKSIKQNRAIKRQMQYVAKILRQLDTTQLQKEYRHYFLKINQNKDEFHACEDWRDKFLNNDKSVFSDFLEKYPSVDRQHLRQLQRNALTEKEQQKSPKYARILYKYLKDSIEHN